MKSKMEPQTNELLQAVGKIALAQQQPARQAEQQYSIEVEAILRDQCREPQRIECLLDGMLDFCFDDEMLRLYKKLCRYYFKMDPMATASYVYTYREMWDEEEKFKNGAIGVAGNELKPLDGFLKGLEYLR